jgi:hypothetical protein
MSCEPSHVLLASLSGFTHDCLWSYVCMQRCCWCCWCCCHRRFMVSCQRSSCHSRSEAVRACPRRLRPRARRCGDRAVQGEHPQGCGCSKWRQEATMTRLRSPGLIPKTGAHFVQAGCLSLNHLRCSKNSKQHDHHHGRIAVIGFPQPHSYLRHQDLDPCACSPHSAGPLGVSCCCPAPPRGACRRRCCRERGGA